MSKGTVRLPPIHLGTGVQGEARREALEAWAAREGCYWNDGPSIGQLVTRLADMELLLRALRRRGGPIQPADLLGDHGGMGYLEARAALRYEVQRVGIAAGRERFLALLTRHILAGFAPPHLAHLTQDEKDWQIEFDTSRVLRAEGMEPYKRLEGFQALAALGKEEGDGAPL